MKQTKTRLCCCWRKTIVSLMYFTISWQECSVVRTLCFNKSRNLQNRSSWIRICKRKRKVLKISKMISKIQGIFWTWNTILRSDIKSWYPSGNKKKCTKSLSSWILCVKVATSQLSSSLVDNKTMKKTSKIKKQLHLLIWSTKFKEHSSISLTQWEIMFFQTSELSNSFLSWWTLC